MASLKLVKINSTGPDVGNWQYFLRGRGCFFGEVNEKFDEESFSGYNRVSKKDIILQSGWGSR